MAFDSKAAPDISGQIFKAVREGNSNFLRKLLNRHPDYVNIRDISSILNQTPLHKASRYGKADVITLLLQKGASINEVDNYRNNTPLHIAAQWGGVKAVKVLCEHGADVNMTNKRNRTPLHEASYHGEADVITLLLQKGASINEVDNDGYTPLHDAVICGLVEAVKVLCEHGANVNITNKSGDTPLHDAALYGQVEAVKVLCEHGANVNMTSKIGNTPLHYAQNNKKFETVKILTEYGAVDNRINKESTDDVKTEDTNDSEYVAKLKYNYEKRLSAKEAEINQLNDAVKGLKLRENEVKVENEMLKRRIEQLRESSKKHIDETVEVTHATDYIARVKEINQLKDTVSLLKIKEDELETENKNLKLQLRRFSKESFDDVSEFKSKADGTTENVATLKNDYEEISAKQIEINQLEDDISVLKIKQIEIETENRRLKSRIEKSRDSSKKHVEYQNKLEAENKKLRLEIEQLRKSSKSEDTVDTDSSNVDVTSKILEYGSYYVSYEAQYCGKKCMAKKEDVENNISKKLLKREGKFLRHLNHPCVVQHLAMLNDLNPPVLLMEKMSMSLTEFLTSKQSHHVKISILHDTARGLHYIHNKGIVHSDLNGDNILLTENVTAKLANFGRANFCQQHMKYLPETLHHLPPEIFEPYSKTNCSTKVDVFSFGCVIIHTFTQERPIPDLDKCIETSESGKYKKHSEVEKGMVYINKIKKDVNTIKFYNIVLKCLQDNPDHRPTVATLLSLLDDERLAINFTKFFKFVDDTRPKLFESEKCATSVSLVLVERLKLLTTLNVSGCNITKQGADMMATVLLNTVSLTILDLSNTMLNSTRANKIISALKNVSSLKILSINNNDIDDGFTESIAAVLCSNHLIEHVNLSHNKLSYTGVLNIANSLSENIKKIDISGNFIASDNVVDLATALSKCSLLQELNISRNLLKLTGVLTIAQFLRHHPTLKILDLSNNNVSFSSACEFIVDVILSVNKTLVNLNVCGRNIRPRYVEEHLSPPSKGNDSTAFTLQNLYSLQRFSIDIPTKFVKVTETCPISNEDIMSYYVDHLGSVFYNQYHNCAIVIPPGAVSQGDCVEIQTTANYFGPYIIPEGFYPISSYYWVSANYEFKAPVYFIMNHYAKIRSLEDISNLHVLHKCVQDSDTMKNDLMMSKITDGVYFDIEIGYCVLATNHFCSYCQAKDIRHIPEYLSACYCTFDESISGSHVAEVCFCPSNSECKKVVMQQCAKRNTELQCSDSFVIKDGEELYISSIDLSNVKNQEWILNQRGRLTITHLCDFEYWEIFDGLTVEQIREREESFEYPPRLQIKCEQIDNSKSLYSSFKISKRSKDKEKPIAQFPLVKKVAVTSETNTATTASPNISTQSEVFNKMTSETTAIIATSSSINTQSETLNKKPKIWKLKKLVIPEVKAHWEDLAYSLDYETVQIKAIERDGKDVSERCTKLLQDWVDTNHGCTPKTWEKLLERIKDVDELYAAAERIEEGLFGAN